MVYSSCCGARLDRISRTVKECSACKKLHYDNPKGTVAVILRQADKIVFSRRAIDPFKGSLDCLGGFLDWGENFEDAAYRELKEEVGLEKNQIKNLTYLGSAFDEYPWAGSAVPIVGVYFLADIDKEIILLPGDDVVKVEFFKHSDIPYDELPWSGMTQILKDKIG